MLQIDRTRKKPYYVQIYEYYRKEIEQQHMAGGTKLESVRELAQAVGVSKMIVERAYYQLASEGYILRRHKARYEVALLDKRGQAALPPQQPARRLQAEWQYDFGSGAMDLNCFPLDTWRKHMNRVLSSPELLSSCQDEQGVWTLRDVLSHYAYAERGVRASAENIIVGAGTAPLLAILTQLLRDDHASVAVEDPGFRLGREIFRSSGYGIVPLTLHQGDFDLSPLQASKARLAYISPSHQFPTGSVMPVGLRYQLLRWAEARSGLIIEDDYDSELRYYGRPVPALQSLDSGGHVIYMGALSKVLPFFLRLSYMVLPPQLMAKYNERRSLFRQSASVAEQCALAAYIRKGDLTRQIRRLRKEYQDKGGLMRRLLQAAFGSSLHVGKIVSGVYCHVSLRSDCTEEELLRRAAAKGCRVLALAPFYETKEEGEKCQFLLSFSKIPGADLPAAVAALKAAWLGEGD